MKMLRWITFGGLCLSGAACWTLWGCELLGGSYASDVQPKETLKAFWEHAQPDNVHGWGLALYRGNATAVFKEAQAANSSALAQFVTQSEGAQASLFIAHIREASVGGQQFHNTHPFVREWQGKEYVLAHNGTLRNFKSKLSLNGFTPIGTTDSEYALCYLLGRIKTKGIARWTRADWQWLEGEFKNVNATGSFNCLFSDGTYFFAYHDRKGYNTLHWRQDEENGVLVSTKPVDEHSWQACEVGKLMVFQAGKKVY